MSVFPGDAAGHNTGRPVLAKQISRIDAILRVATGVMDHGTLFQRAKPPETGMIATAARSPAGENGTGMASSARSPALRTRDGGPDHLIGATFAPKKACG